MVSISNQGSAEHAILPNFCIVTREPNELVARIHNRQPVILREENMARWLDPSPLAETELRKICEAIPAAEMREREVSTHINNVKHEGEECFGPPTARPIEMAPPPKVAKRVDPNQMGLEF